MKTKLSAVIILQMLFAGAICYPQDLKERQWVTSMASEQGGMEGVNPSEKERVVRNRIQSVEEWEYSYSFGEADKNGTRVKAKSYDAHGNITSYWDPYSEYKFTVDASGRRTEMTLTDKERRPAYISKTTFGYDKNGNLVETNKTNCMVGNAPCKDIDEYDSNNRRIKHIHLINGDISDKYLLSYDDNGRCIEKVVFAKDGSTKSMVYKYDPKGKPLNDDEYRYEYVYLDRSVEKKSYSRYDQGRLSQTIISKYDSKGNLIQESNIIETTYIGKPPKVLNPTSQAITSYKYDEKDRILEQKSGYKSGTFAWVDVLKYSYDAKGQVAQETRTRVGREAEAAVTTFKYAENGNILEILSLDLRGKPNSVRRFVYTTY